MARLSDIRLRRSAVSGSIPSTSNLNLGELALNTADGKVYMKKSVGGTDTVVEVGAGGGIAASFIAYEYTATANQTTFSGTDNNSNTLAYNTGTPPSVQVFMNGILLDEGSSQDYTGTNGTSVVLTTAADAGDLIQIHAYKSDVSIVSDLSFADNQKLKFGDSSDLQIYHDGNNSRVEDTGTGGLRLIGGNFVSLQSTSGENMVVATENGAVTLYHNNSAKLATTSTGIDVTGTVTSDGLVVDGNITNSSGDLTLDVVGNINLDADGSAIRFKDGGTSFGEVFKSSSNMIVYSTISNGDMKFMGVDGSSNITALTLDMSNAGKALFNAGANFGSGIDVTGTISSGAITSSDLITADDLALEVAGAASELKFIQGGAFRSSLSYNNATGLMILDNKYSSVDIHAGSGGTSSIRGRFNTSGLTVTGTVTATGKLTLNDPSVGGWIQSNGSVRIDIDNDNNQTDRAFIVSKNNSASNLLTIFESGAATFAGTISSGAITSSGSIVGSTVQATVNLFGTNGLHTLNTAGNGWDHTINRNGGNPTANLPGGITSGNITTTGYLRGPSTFTIDPAAHGDDTGTVVIAGNLQIDGTTTTINSTTLTVDDKNITLASGSANAAAANGAGLTVAGASANIVYESINDRWTLNKEVFSSQGFMIGTTGTDVGLIKNSSGVFDFQAQSAREISFSNVTNGEHVRIDADGNLGIGTNNPQTKLHVEGITRITESNNTAFYGGDYVRVFGNQYFNFRNTSGSTIARIHMAGDSYFNGGDVGIGTSSPSEKLHVAGNQYIDGNLQIKSAGVGNAMSILQSTSGNIVAKMGESAVGHGFLTLYEVSVGDVIKFDANADSFINRGKLGIGTTSPIDLLHIKSSTTDARQVIDGHTGYDAELKFAENGTVKYTIGHDAASDNFVIGTTNVDTQQRIVINSAGNVGVGVTSIPSWANLMTDGTVAVGGTLYMKTGNPIQALSAFPGGADDLKMQTGGGKVTIGGPGGNTTGHLELYGRYSGSDPKLSFRSDHPTSGDTTVWDMARITADDGGNYNGVLHFQVAAGNGSNGAGAALATAMTIQDTKYVGIGTTSPDTNLEVDIKNGADGNGIHITSTSTTNDPTLKLTRNGSADRFQFMVRGGAGSARLGISAGTALDSGLNLGSNNGLSIGTVTAAGSGGLLVDNDIKSNSRFGVGSGGSLSDAAIYKNSDTNTGIYWPGADQIALTTAGSSRLHINSTGGVSLGTQSQLTTGGNARLSIIDSSVQLSMGASNSDMSYIRKNGAGQFAWQTYNSGNSGILQLQPYGGNVTINTTAAVSGHALSVSGRIGGLTYSDSYLQFTGGNTVLKANDDVVIGYSSSLYVKQGGNVGVGTTDPQAQLQVKQLGINVNQSSVTSTSQYTCDSMSATVFRSARYTVQITNTTDSTYQITEILLIHDGTTPSMTEYGTIFTGSAREASFDADIVSGNVRLLATPASSDSMQFKAVRHSILV